MDKVRLEAKDARVCRDSSSGQWVVCFEPEHLNPAFSHYTPPYTLVEAQSIKRGLDYGRIDGPQGIDR